MSGPHYASPESYKGKCGQDVWSTFEARLPVEQSRRHRGALVGLAPHTKLQVPPNWNMKHYQSVEFLSNWMSSSPYINVKPTRTHVKPSYWRLYAAECLNSPIKLVFSNCICVANIICRGKASVQHMMREPWFVQLGMPGTPAHWQEVHCVVTRWSTTVLTLDIACKSMHQFKKMMNFCKTNSWFQWRFAKRFLTAARISCR